MVIVTEQAVAQQGNSCQVWRRECTRLFGQQTPNWRACMNQPAVVQACGGRRAGGGGGGGAARNSATNNCATWRRECTRLFGQQTPNWRACMNQPAVVQACGGRRAGGGGGAARSSNTNPCATWQQQCAQLHGRGTANWNACMNQPGALQACGGRRAGGGGGATRSTTTDACSTWRQQCSRLYGRGTSNWNACMNQPSARQACGGYSAGGGGGGGAGVSSACARWQQQCASLYGDGTPRWNACMRQPAALNDCGGLSRRLQNLDRGPHDR
jgi:hypothetical protein